MRRLPFAIGSTVLLATTIAAACDAQRRQTRAEEVTFTSRGTRQPAAGTCLLTHRRIRVP
jgi:hypothetical protein